MAEVAGRARQQPDVLDLDRLEALQRDRHRVRAGIQGRERVRARRVRHGGLRHAGRVVLHDDGGAGNDAAVLVDDDAGQRLAELAPCANAGADTRASANASNTIPVFVMM